ncbi:MAG: ATP-grasp domain-containing protein [Pararhodobacter sp.]|nr:ATP-grasp domain-containing protein [Pararhodobacter sp.]
MKDASSQPVIAVSGLHRGESPQSGGAVIESIRARMPQARFIGISYDAMETGLYSRNGDHVDAAYLFPYPVAGPGELLKRLREVHEAEGLSLIIPTLDSELENLLTVQSSLGEMGIKVAIPSRSSLQARSKSVLDLLGKRADVPVPRTFAANDPVTLAGHALNIGYPCYVKGALYDARLVYNEAQLYEAFNTICAVWGPPVLVQEAIYGEEYGVAGVGDGKGRLVCHCAIRKLLRSKLGKGYGGVVIEDPVVNDITLRLVKELKWDGPFEIELVKPAGREHHLFEINPRFPAWISFPAKAGCNMPAYVAERALGLVAAAPGKVPAGKMFFRHSEDMVADIGDVARIITHGVTEYAADDEHPAPDTGEQQIRKPVTP